MRDEVMGFLFSPYGIFALLLLPRIVLCTWAERRWPAHTFDYRAVLLADIATYVFWLGAIRPAADFACSLFAISPAPPASIAALPGVVRIALYLLLADLGHYWVHRLMHMPLLWRIHKWHHTPAHMSWLSGNRESLLDRILVNLPYIFFYPLLWSTPWWTGPLLLMVAILKNDWMHLNVSWRLAWLEWLVVTPRFHHIHHSANPAHYTKNLAPLFPIWDRLFGTWCDPREAEALTFGIGEKVPPARLVIGV